MGVLDPHEGERHRPPVDHLLILPLRLDVLRQECSKVRSEPQRVSPAYNRVVGGQREDPVVESVHPLHPVGVDGLVPRV